MDKYNDIISKIETMTVVELSELVKAIETKFGISAAMPTAAAGPAVAAAEKTTYDVILKAAGDQKINVIKIVREITGLGLKESKDLVDGAPKTVKADLKKEEAEEMKKKIEAVGATVELK